MSALLKEPELFSYLKQYYYPDLEKSPGKFSKYDCISDSEKMYIELKSRNTHYDDLLIEQIKYQAIVDAAKFLGFKAYYINSTPEGAWSFNLSDMPEPVWEDRWLPANTEFSNRGNKTKIVGYLHIKDGVKL